MSQLNLIFEGHQKAIQLNSFPEFTMIFKKMNKWLKKLSAVCWICRVSPTWLQCLMKIYLSFYFLLFLCDLSLLLLPPCFCFSHLCVSHPSPCTFSLADDCHDHCGLSPVVTADSRVFYPAVSRDSPLPPFFQFPTSFRSCLLPFLCY